VVCDRWFRIKEEEKIETMAEPQDSAFTCPNCGARYKVVRVEEAPSAADRERQSISR
jgi:hypothetical protein